ncbi:MAG: endolytic transglycosylase MltG [bacterium]
MPPNSKSGRQPILRVVLLTLTAGILLLGEFLGQFFVGKAPSSFPWNPVRIVISSGASVREIGQRLFVAGLVDQPDIFRLAARFFDAEHDLQAGQLTLSPGLPLKRLIQSLTKVQAAGVRVVIREGLTAAQIAELLQSAAEIDSNQFMGAVYDTAFAESLGLSNVGLEGYLFPDTYFFYERMDARRAAMRMVLNFLRRVPDTIFVAGARFDLDRHQAMTLASILQWEVLWPPEWEIVSAVYHNRLQKNMLLQADPTVSYVLGRGPSRLTLRDLRVDSPYNTYRYKGLPPGPINNPGLRAIQAALNPAKADYLFFVAREDGSHAFTRTAREHLRAKAEADKARRQAQKDTSEAG